MNQDIRTAPRLHPLVAAAAASVIVVSAAGVAALTGLLPTSKAPTGPPIRNPTKHIGFYHKKG